MISNRLCQECTQKGTSVDRPEAGRFAQFGGRGFFKDFRIQASETNPKHRRSQPLFPWRYKSAETLDIINFV
ncbi:hypothetical protein QUA27_01895 [Microcoleus sp. Pol14C6]|uniref:hypothetical protein n=1 Tax=unclassified Microcoleus TaxID=2642155 RepID=UPI002FD40730